MGNDMSTPCMKWCKGAKIDLTVPEVQSATSMKICDLCQANLRYKMKQDSETAIQANATELRIKEIQKKEAVDKEALKLQNQYRREQAEQTEKYRVYEHTRQEEMKKKEHDRKTEQMRLAHTHTIERLEKEKEKKEVEMKIKKMVTDKEMRKMQMDHKKEMREAELEELRLKVELAKIEKEDNRENSHIPASKQRLNIKHMFQLSRQAH